MAREQPMKHLFGIGLLIAVALSFKWWIHPNFFIAYTSGHGLKGTAIDVVIYRVSLAIAALWSLALGLAFVFKRA
jgi:hypothetical protein